MRSGRDNRLIGFIQRTTIYRRKHRAGVTQLFSEEATRSVLTGVAARVLGHRAARERGFLNHAGSREADAKFAPFLARATRGYARRPAAASRISLPTQCWSCGAYLIGGGTRHAPGCEIRLLIESYFRPHFEARLVRSAPPRQNERSNIAPLMPVPRPTPGVHSARLPRPARPAAASGLRFGGVGGRC